MRAAYNPQKCWSRLEPTRGLEPRTARLQEAFVPCIYCLVLKILNSTMPIDALRGSQRHEFDDTADDRPSTVDRINPRPSPDLPQVTSRDSLIRLVGAVLAEQHDEWTEMRRYVDLDILAKSRLTIVENTEPEEVTLTAITA
jgi:hypothetical protein